MCRQCLLPFLSSLRNSSPVSGFYCHFLNTDMFQRNHPFSQTRHSNFIMLPKLVSVTKLGSYTSSDGTVWGQPLPKDVRIALKCTVFCILSGFQWLRVFTERILYSPVVFIMLYSDFNEYRVENSRTCSLPSLNSRACDTNKIWFNLGPFFSAQEKCYFKVIHPPRDF